MATSRALARLTGFASRATRDALPLARRTWSHVQEVADDVAISLLGRDFEERLKRVPVKLAHGKVDPFGFDLDTAKYAVASAAFFHRVYFRSEVFGIDRVPHGRVLLIANNFVHYNL